MITRTPGGLVQRPPDGKKSLLSLFQDERLSNDRHSVVQGAMDVVDLTNEIADQSSAKRKAVLLIQAENEVKKPSKHGHVAAAKNAVETGD